jgi:hypothetical protein
MSVRTLIGIVREVKNLPALFMKILSQSRIRDCDESPEESRLAYSTDSWLTYLNPMVIKWPSTESFFMG